MLAARLLGPLKMTGKQTGWIYATLPLACIFVAAAWPASWPTSGSTPKWILAVAHLVGGRAAVRRGQADGVRALFVVMLLYSTVLRRHAAAGERRAVRPHRHRSRRHKSMSAYVFMWAPVAWALVGLLPDRLAVDVQDDGATDATACILAGVLRGDGGGLLLRLDSPDAAAEHGRDSDRSTPSPC